MEEEALLPSFPPSAPSPLFPLHFFGGRVGWFADLDSKERVREREGHTLAASLTALPLHTLTHICLAHVFSSK